MLGILRRGQLARKFCQVKRWQQVSGNIDDIMEMSYSEKKLNIQSKEKWVEEKTLLNILHLEKLRDQQIDFDKLNMNILKTKKYFESTVLSKQEIEFLSGEYLPPVAGQILDQSRL